MPDLLKYPQKLGSAGFQNWIMFTSSPFNGTGEGLVDVALYMPQDALTTEYKASFGAQALGSLLGGATKGGEVSDMKAFAANMDAKAKVVTSDAGAVGTLMFAAKKGEGLGALASKTQGAVLNPFMITAYEGPKEMRSFEYTFDFWPESSSEANEVARIIKVLKMAMLPSSGKGDVSSSMLLGYPEKFTIKYFVNGQHANTHKNLFGYGESVLTGMTVDHATETSMAFHDDGHALHTQMKLSFMETQIVTRERVENEGL